MGCGMSVEEKEGKQRNEEIENQLRKDRMSARNEIKMLLLGAPVSCRPIDSHRQAAMLTTPQVPGNLANRPSSSR